MPKLFGREWTKDELLTHIGHIDQVGGLKRFQLVEGNTAGCESVEFRTGTGFRFNVLPGRGMDISECEYCGESISWRSQTGDIASSYFESAGYGWFRSFFGGLLTTCGMSWAGPPHVDPNAGVEGDPSLYINVGTGEGNHFNWLHSGGLGIHGRVSNIPARNVHVDGEWIGDDYVFWCQGKVTEAQVFKTNLQLTRKISTKLGENKFWVYDTVENLAHDPQEHMYTYHCNFGFPLCQEGSKILINSRHVEPYNKGSAEYLNEWSQLPKPTSGIPEMCYYHDVVRDKDGNSIVAIINRSVSNGRGLGCYIKYDANTMPYFIQWKMPEKGRYVVGLEPSNCMIEGRYRHRLDGTLKLLEPGEKVEYRVEFGILTNHEEITNIEELIYN